MVAKRLKTIEKAIFDKIDLVYWTRFTLFTDKLGHFHTVFSLFKKHSSLTSRQIFRLQMSI